MASGLSARVVFVCAVLVTASPALAQVPTQVPADRPPVSSPTARPPAAAPPTGQPTIAQASGKRQVAVIDLSTDPAAEKLANELYNALVDHVDLRPLTNPNFVRSLKGPFADEERLYLETARQAKRQAGDFLANLEWGSAENVAERGFEALHNVRPLPDVLGLYAELAFDAGLAALRQRNPNRASQLFGLSNRLDPGKRPNPTRYQPEIVDAYQYAVTRIPVTTKLEVKGSGTVWIDGIDRGAPGAFDVSEGLHLVQLSGPDRETRGRQVGVPQATAVEIEPAPASDERKVERLRIELAQTRDAAARAGAVKRLAQLLGVGDAVLIEKSETGALRVQTWRDREPGFSKVVDHGSEPAGDLLVPLAPPRKVVPARPEEIDPLPPVVIEAPFYRKNWFYGSVALGVVAAGIAIFVAVTSDRMQAFDFDVKPEGE
jgi:hypothetical protein